ncbi:bifunctional tetrahydrofolate synthase/dihydrofolate synthase [Arenimonas sp.]|uniref:bifunctional tetrahydrofolate synthase/dihydrofolate synthase n=1 Tax=Arenimonas sp. TaxID=1872635 RepID=UPI0039E27BD8
MKRDLAEWLEYQLRTHPQSIAMGLDRVREVATRLGIGRPGENVIIVGGTNGKGSTVAFIEAIARAAGLRVGAFTSPHLLRYNERIRVDGIDASDEMLVAAFERIETARGRAGEDPVPLTYFEFGTLAALLILEAAQPDIAILEVGLGGRLDAVNIIDADVAVITTVDLDHQEYLGPDRETIGADKAGILRAGKLCVLGEKDPPSSVLRRAYEIGASAIRGHSDYLIDRLDEGWRWREPGFELDLPMPALVAPAQLDNAAAAIAALRALPIEIGELAYCEGVARARVPGRLQKVADAPEIVLDVGHNPQAVRQIEAWLRAHPKPTIAVFSALADKEIGELSRTLTASIREWCVAGIHDAGPRGLSGAEVARRLDGVPAERVRVHGTVAEALASARAAVGPDERVLIFGSFHTVADAMKALRSHADEL